MKLVWYNIAFLIMLTACRSKSADMANDSISADSSAVRIKTRQKRTVTIEIDTININCHKYIRTLKDSHFNCLLSTNGDTIVRSEDYYSKLELIDVDEDGYQDIRVFAYSNTPNQCDNYLFDKKSSSFVLIDNCSLEITKLKGTNFFYSYNRAGCADLNWESTLSKIETFKLVDYGKMYGHGCDFEIEKNPQNIEIYRVSHSHLDEKILIETLPYKNQIKKFGNKWNFIENFRSNNYETFER